MVQTILRSPIHLRWPQPARPRFTLQQPVQRLSLHAQQRSARPSSPQGNLVCLSRSTVQILPRSLPPGTAYLKFQRAATPESGGLQSRSGAGIASVWDNNMVQQERISINRFSWPLGHWAFYPHGSIRGLYGLFGNVSTLTVGHPHKGGKNKGRETGRTST